MRRGVFTGAGLTLTCPGAREGPAVAFVRPDQLAPTTEHGAGLQVRLDRVTARGPLLWLECTGPDGTSLEAATPRSDDTLPEPGGPLRLAASGGQVFAAP